MIKLAIFASGTGSNFAALLTAIDEGSLSAKVTLLVCDKVGAPVIEKAKRKSISTFVFTPKAYNTKARYEEAILNNLKKHQVDWVILAGYMRLIGPVLLTAYDGRIINIHPSLLPKYKGKDAIERAFNAGEKEIGVSIHYVDAGMDTGEVITQEAIPLTGEETLLEVKAKIHQVEHRLYPETLERLFKSFLT